MEKLFRKWKRQKLIEQTLISLGIGLPISSLVWLFLNISILHYLPILLLLSGVILFGLLHKSGFFSLGLPDLAHYLNQTYPVLEQSSDLLLEEESVLGGIVRLQKERVAQKFSALKVVFPNRFLLAFFLLFIGGLMAWGIYQLPLTFAKGKPIGFEQYKDGVQLLSSDTVALSVPPKLLKAKIRIQPPAYTRIAAKTTKALEAEAPYWSKLTWVLNFDQTLSEVALIFGDGNVLQLKDTGEKAYKASLKVEKSTFYQVKFRGNQGGWQLSDYYQIKVIEDRPPEIEVQGLPSYAEYVFNPEKTVSFVVSINDDYGIANAWIIATLSKGEGESVKFRDDTLVFNQSFEARERQYHLNKTLRLGDLNMESGDELYLHMEAIDQRMPNAHVSKTYKYILAFENPDKMQVDMAGGLAVNRMPEYFRSQRQIIIDTEKLIAERAKLKTLTFNERSNNIAIDQKLLRLRYGRFLGEEFETVIGAENPMTEEDHDHADHDHSDHDHVEHQAEQQSEDQYLAEDHDHETEGSWGGSSEDEEIKELEPYVHAHDITEEVTYFDATTTAKLRVALSEMWNAELHLRLGNPEKALPYEYKALKLIKEIQQASRIYVERIGFDPPVIKVAEKRLTGELKKVRNSTMMDQTEQATDYPALRAALPLLELLKKESGGLTVSQKKRLEEAGDELAGLALEQPGGFLISLQKLRSILEEEVELGLRRSYLNDLQKAFWDVLSDKVQPVQQTHIKSNLQDLFLQELLKR